MISRLPKWILLGGSVLSLMGGFINAIGFVSVYHEAVTHLTGTTTSLGIAVANGDTAAALPLIATVFFFVLGATVSAFFIKDAVLQLGRRYGAVMMMEGVLLFASAYLLGRGQWLGLALATGACGMQNGMVSAFSGAVVRTTHVSGIMTDLGILLGQSLRGLPVDQRKAKLYSALAGSFFAGAILGAWCFDRLGALALCVPATVLFSIGICYIVYWHRQRLQRSDGKNSRV
jgi:uncharacterized membrane protein YoaK (UPF0700 family)